MFEALKKFAVFEGRARRSEYWLFTLFLCVANLVLTMLMIGAVSAGGTDAASDVAGGGGALFLLALIVFNLAMLIPSLAVSFRRLHDIDRSAAWLLLALVPFGGLVIFIFTLIDGTPGPNRYGEDPKSRQPLSAGPVQIHHHYHTAPPADPA